MNRRLRFASTAVIELRRLKCRRVMLAVIAATAVASRLSPAAAALVYQNDFSGGAGSEWSPASTATSNGERFLATSPEGFGNSVVTLNLTGLPAHTDVTVDFDLYIIRSWDGNGTFCCGPDNWRLTANGSIVFFSNFANYTSGNTQAFPNQLPPLGGGGSFSPRTGAFANGHLGFGSGDFGDATYRLSVTFPHSDPNLVLGFAGLEDQFPGDEGWGLDNVSVDVSNGSGLSFQNISESSPTDPVPLFGSPSHFPGGLDFNPMSFAASAQDGAADMTQGNLSFKVKSAGAIKSINFSEAGDYALLGAGTSATNASVAVTMFVTVTEIDGIAVAPISLPPTVASVSFNLLANPGIVEPWALGGVVDVAGQLPAGQNATKVDVLIDNKLNAASESATVAFIAKKDFTIHVDAIIPEPNSIGMAVLAFCGFIGLEVRQRLSKSTAVTRRANG